MLTVLIIAVLAFVAGVTEGQRVINAVENSAKQIHDRIASLEERLKEKL